MAIETRPAGWEDVVDDDFAAVDNAAERGEQFRQLSEHCQDLRKQLAAKPRCYSPFEWGLGVGLGLFVSWILGIIAWVVLLITFLNR